jgi:hypothetical protein
MTDLQMFYAITSWINAARRSGFGRLDNERINMALTVNGGQDFQVRLVLSSVDVSALARFIGRALYIRGGHNDFEMFSRGGRPAGGDVAAVEVVIKGIPRTAYDRCIFSIA